MKKTAIYYFSLAAILAGSVSSCREADLGFSSEEIARVKFEKEYNENFEREYGKIAPGHTWGFGEGELTRGTRGTSTNRYKIVRQPGYVDLPGGGRDNFTVDPQCVQGSNTMSEKQFAGHNCPAEITTLEKIYVFWYLRKHPDVVNTDCPFDNYFMQDLHQDPYPGGYNEDGSYSGDVHCPGWGQMNNLHFDEIHFNDFNGTGYSPDYYVTNTQITTPYYEDSWGTGDVKRTNHYSYYYIPPFNGKFKLEDETEYEIDFLGGCYLCFDYEGNKPNEGTSKPRDKVYDDWVIKLTAGQYATWRVFCEDLGSTLDLDFNDLVFDYVQYSHGLEITIKALVGTLKIDMIVGPVTEHIKTGNSIQQTVNDRYYFSGASLSDVQIAVESVDGKGTCFIANTPSRAPYLLKVAAGTAWPSENQRIEHKYPTFKTYVSSPTSAPDWWDNFNIADITPGDEQYHTNN